MRISDWSSDVCSSDLPAAYVANLVEGRVAAYFGQGNFRHHNVIGKRGCSHVMVHRLAADSKARSAVWHQTLALGGTCGGAKIGFARQAGFTLTAFGRV